ncbi:unnamed protein product [Coregonus sp. 'balchen']|nr:unnamed protein product [Coregonus sp. 'balchen']
MLSLAQLSPTGPAETVPSGAVAPAQEPAQYTTRLLKSYVGEWQGLSACLLSSDRYKIGSPSWEALNPVVLTESLSGWGEDELDSVQSQPCPAVLAVSSVLLLMLGGCVLLDRVPAAGGIMPGGCWFEP